MAKSKPSKAKASEPDDGIRKHDRKVLERFLAEVKDELWGVSSSDREKALADLRAHILERYRPHQSDHAMEMAISAVGSPEVLAKGVRTLYGYGTGFKSGLVILSFLMGLATVPSFEIWSNSAEWSILGLLATFMLLSAVGPLVGLRWGGLMGLAAGASRVLFVLVMALGMPDDFSIGTGQAVIDFTLASLFLVLVGALAGNIRETSMKGLLQEEAV